MLPNLSTSSIRSVHGVLVSGGIVGGCSRDLEATGADGVHENASGEPVISTPCSCTRTVWSPFVCGS